VLDIKKIRINFENVLLRLATREVKPETLVELKEFDKSRRKLLIKIEKLKNIRNMTSQKIAQMKRARKNWRRN
jgi:seryl-tRNA synthetase